MPVHYHRQSFDQERLKNWLAAGYVMQVSENNFVFTGLSVRILNNKR